MENKGEPSDFGGNGGHRTIFGLYARTSDNYMFLITL